MQREWDASLLCDRFARVDMLSEGKNFVGYEWVSVTKCEATGQVVKHKARFVAQNVSQVYDIDYTETFITAVDFELLRLIFTTAIQGRCHRKLMDVSSAYLYGTTSSETYIVANGSFLLDVQPRFLLRVHSSLRDSRAQDENDIKPSLKVLYLCAFVDVPSMFAHERTLVTTASSSSVWTIWLQWRIQGPNWRR